MAEIKNIPPPPPPPPTNNAGSVPPPPPPSTGGASTGFTNASSEPSEGATTEQSKVGTPSPYDIRKNSVKLEGQESPSTVLMESGGYDGKEYAYPTLFPKDPNNQTSDPKDWIRLEGGEAFDEAKKRKEVWEFDSQKEADKFARGSWKKEQPLQPSEESGTPSPLVEQELPVGIASREELISNIKDPYIKRQEQILLSASDEKKRLINELPIKETRQRIFNSLQPLIDQKQRELQDSLNNGEITEEYANEQINGYYEKANQQVNKKLESDFELNNKLKEVNEKVNEKAFKELNAVMDDKKAAIDLAYQEQMEQLSPLESIGNALYNSALMTSLIPAKTILLGEQLSEDFTVSLPIALYGILSGQDISDKTKQLVRGASQSVTQQQAAYKEIQDTEEKLKPTLPFLESLEKGEIDKASAAAVGTAVDFLRSMVTGTATMGTGTFGEIGAPMYMEAVRAKAKETGKKEEDIIAEDLEDETTALLSAGLATASEFYGLGTAANLMRNSIFKAGVKDQVKKNIPKLVSLGKDISVASLKESGTEIFQQSVEKANKAALENGGIKTDEGRKAFLKESFNATFTKDAAETGASTFAGSMLLFGMGKGAASLRKTKAVIDKPTQELTDEEIKEVLNSKGDLEQLTEKIKGMYQSGALTEEGYNISQDKINRVLKYDSELSPTNNNREESIRLLAEREKLEAEMGSLHPTQRGGEQAKIAVIDKKLIELATEGIATKETTTEEAPLVTDESGEVVTVYRGGKSASGVQYYTSDQKLAEGIGEAKGEGVQKATVRMANPWTPESLDVNNAPQWMQDWVRSQEEFTTVDEETMAAEEIPMEQAIQEIKDMQLSFRDVGLWQSFVNEALEHHDGIIAFDPSEDMAADKKIYITKSPEQVVTEETTEGKKEVTNAEKTKIAEEIGKVRKVKPKNIKGLLDVMGGIFGLNKKQAESASVVGNVIIGNMAKRAGISKDEMYQKIAYQKAQKAPDGSLKQMISEDADGNVIFESSVKRGLSELPNNPMTPDAWVAQISKKGGRGTQEELYVIGVLDKNSDGNYVVSQNFKDAIGWIGDKKVDLKDQKAIDGKYWKSVPKEVVEKYINDNQIEIVEVTKGGSTPKLVFDTDVEGRWQAEDPTGTFSGDYTIQWLRNESKFELESADGFISLHNSFEEATDRANEHILSNQVGEVEGQTKYSGYTLEGGENYREVLLTLPSQESKVKEVRVRKSDIKIVDSKTVKGRKEVIHNGNTLQEFDPKEGERANEGFIYYTNERGEFSFNRQDLVENNNPKEYKSSHWDESNILAHVRINERTLPNGERVMFIEEVQSDWAQEGKKKGFGKATPVNREDVEIVSSGEWVSSNKDGAEYRLTLNIRGEEIYTAYRTKSVSDESINLAIESQIQRALDAYNNNLGLGRTPDMPYKKTDQWVGMAMRRVMQMAAQEGFDRVAWVTGEQSADRYDLSKQVDRVEVADMLDGNRSVYISMKDNSDTQLFVDPKTGKILQSTDKGIDGKMLEDVVGKEISNKILNLNTEKESVISSEGLKIGGEGMKAFYNSILPKVAQKEAQRFDKSAKVKVVDFGDNTRKVIVDVQRDGSIRLINEGGGFIAEYNKNQFDEAYKEADRLNERIDNSQIVGRQLSIPITPEMRMNLNNAVPLFQGARGAMTAADGNYVVYALTNPNVSTPLHELAHVYEHYLTDKERADIESWSGHNAGTVEFSEAFARGFEKFLAGGKVNNPRLQKIFENFKEWLTEIYNGITGSEIDIELNDKMKSIYNDMLGANPEKVKLSILDSVGDEKAVRKGISDYINDLEKSGRITVNQSANWLKKLNNTNLASKKAVDEFLTDIEKGFKDAATKQKQSNVNSKVKRAGKMARGKSKVGQAAKALSKINAKKIEDENLLDEIEKIADDLLTKSPTTTVADINELLSKYNKEVAEQQKNTPQKSITEKIKDYKKKRAKAETFSQFINLEVERQQIIGEYLDSEQDIDPELVRELEEEIEIDIESNKITTAQLASQSRGNLTRAKNAIDKAVKDGVITEEKAEELNSKLKEQVDIFKKELDKFTVQESKKYKKSVLKLKGLTLDGVEADEVRLLLEAEKVDDAAWLSRFNDAAEAIIAGNIPFKEISDLREFAASKSKRVDKLVDAIEEIDPKGLSVKAWIDRLGTKEAAQRVRNILNSQRDEIYKMVYQPMSNAFTRAKKMSDAMLKDFLKASSPSIFRRDERGFNRVGIIAQYLREASLLGSGTKADGVEVGNRDIFGIWLGNEAAMDAAGLSESEKEYHKKGQAKSMWDNRERKNIEEFYESLPKTEDGYVDVQALSENYESLLNPRERKMLKTAEEVFEKGRDRQEAANLRRGIEFNPQVYYVPTQRKGRIGDVDATTKKFDKFSPQAKQGKEKVTESLRPTFGVYPVNIAEMVINYAEDTSLDYVFSEVQPVTNAILNKTISRTKAGVIANAIKGDYNASLDYEKSIGNTPRMLTKLLGARYAKSLFDPIRSAIEIVAAFTSIPIKVRSARGIADTFNKESWDTLRELEDLTGADIADFKSGDIERRGVKEAVGRENIFIKVGRYTMSIPEYLTAITGFMPVFRREFQSITGESFDRKKFLNNKAYKEQNLQAIKDATAKAQELVERIYGSKTKGGTRRSVEIAPSKFLGIGLSEDGTPITFKADSPQGRLVSFFGNFGYREQGEFFQSLKFIAGDIRNKKGNNAAELANAGGVLMNAITYSYMMGVYYLASQIMFGDDDEAEEAEKRMEEMFTLKGLGDLITNQLTFLAVSKYGKVSRGAAIAVISALYNMAEDKEDKKILADLLKNNFFVNKPINLSSKYDVSVFTGKELLPAVDNLIALGATVNKSREQMVKEDDIDAVVAADLSIAIMNLSLAVGAGTQLPMSNITNKMLKEAKSKRKNNKKKPLTKKYNIN